MKLSLKSTDNLQCLEMVATVFSAGAFSLGLTRPRHGLGTKLYPSPGTGQLPDSLPDNYVTPQFNISNQHYDLLRLRISFKIIQLDYEWWILHVLIKKITICSFMVRRNSFENKKNSTWPIYEKMFHSLAGTWLELAGIWSIWLSCQDQPGWCQTIT